MNPNEIKKSETAFDTPVIPLTLEAKSPDHKHMTNLSTRAVPQSVLDEIEAGCPVETLERIAADFPICKYQTQITIHGVFPELKNRTIGGYVNLTQNKNKSIGVRWNAIDGEKKGRLYEAMSETADFSVYQSSTEWFAQKAKPVSNREELINALADHKAYAERVNRSLFIGNVEVFAGSVFGMVFAVLRVSVKSFYERNFSALRENLCGMTNAEIDRILAEREAKRKVDEAEREARYEASRREYAEREAKQNELNAQWLAANPCPFAKRTNATLKAGDIFAKIAYDEWHYPRVYKGWNFYVVTKSFGRLVATPCDINGVKTGRRGKEIRKLTGDFYVK